MGSVTAEAKKSERRAIILDEIRRRGENSVAINSCLPRFDREHESIQRLFVMRACFDQEVYLLGKCEPSQQEPD